MIKYYRQNLIGDGRKMADARKSDVQQNYFLYMKSMEELLCLLVSIVCQVYFCRGGKVLMMYEIVTIHEMHTLISTRRQRFLTLAI